MARYVAGDAAAFDTLFARYSPRLTAAVRRQVGDLSLTRDLVQQTFLQLHRARHDYDPARPFRPWIFTICFNLRREFFRRRRRRPQVSLEVEGVPEATEGPLDLERAERALQTRRAVSQLPAAQREVIELHWFEELPFREVAEVVGASVTAVKVRAHRGYGRLREILAESSSERNSVTPPGVLLSTLPEPLP